MVKDTRYIRCVDGAEAVVFTRRKYDNYPDDYEINIEDNYCGGDFMGIKGRFRRAWHAFWAKPIYYTGIYVENKELVRTFFNDCLALVEDDDIK